LEDLVSSAGKNGVEEKEILEAITVAKMVRKVQCARRTSSLRPSSKTRRWPKIIQKRDAAAVEMD
jgi:hypothetical protein